MYLANALLYAKSNTPSSYSCIAEHQLLLMSTSSRKVVVIGGGIIGSSTAFYLKKRGVDVTLLEASYVAAGSSGKAGGFLVIPVAAISIRTYSDASGRLWTGMALLRLLSHSCPTVCIKSFPRNLAMLSDTESLQQLL